MKLYCVNARYTFAANCYILADEQKNCVIIDPGAEEENILSVLTQEGLAPLAILLTHGHYDHIGAVNGLRKTYPMLPVYIGQGDLPMVTGKIPEVYDAMLRRTIASSGKSIEDYIISDVQPLQDGQELILGSFSFHVYETPGHSLGSICLACEQFLFTGDTLFCHDIGRTDLYGGSFSEIICSLKKIAALQGDYVVLPGHEQDSTLASERTYISALLKRFDQ